MLRSDDFNACGWRSVVDGVNCPNDYGSLSSAFSIAANRAKEENRLADAKVLRLLSDVCSMQLSTDSVNNPFKPCMVWTGGQTSMIPSDLSDDEIGFFASIVDSIDSSLLIARLADLIWLLQKPRKVKFARMAIDSYRSIPLEPEIWQRGGRKCWQRAIYLAQIRGIGTDEHKSEIEASLVAAFKAAAAMDGKFGLELANLLLSNALGKDDSASIGSRLENLGGELKCQGKLPIALEYLRASAEWHRESGDDLKWAEMTVAVAEGWVEQASTHELSNPPKHSNAARCYDNAIHSYRKIPGTQRETYQVNERISELHERRHESHKESLDQMSTIRSGRIDLSQIADSARDAVIGKSPADALVSFANLRPIVNVKTLRDSVKKRLAYTPLLSLFSRTALSRDGRVIKNVPGDDKEAIYADEMIREYRRDIEVDIKGIIVPALEAMLLEHRFCVDDFIDLAMQSPFVPAGREFLFGRGLYAGCDYNFATAIHLLTPQIEHWVRLFLKQEGVVTTRLDEDRVDTEKGLSSLIGEPEAEKILGQDLRFAIRTLFCEPTGPNLRNMLAHGMLDDNASQSPFAVYAWWLALKLVVNSVLAPPDVDAEIREDDPEE
ncbi:MAG: DUF4209 domain-containing protein [Gemmatimonadota bacterium]|nr:DUF4209 domain-containing protein [Gemmatimonadota bacterium]